MQENFTFHYVYIFSPFLLLGQVLRTDGDVLTVDFLHPGSLKGMFRRPLRGPDVSPIEIKFVFQRMSAPPVPVSGGRMFHVVECKELEDNYKLYKSRYEQFTFRFICYTYSVRCQCSDDLCCYPFYVYYYI